MLGILKKVFGTAQDRTLKKYRKIVSEVNAWEKKFLPLSDEELKGKTAEFKERFKKGESLDALLPEAYAVVKNACRRLCGTQVHVSGYDQKWDMVPYDVQLLGGIAMHYGAIAEMQTGEGKTLTASLPLYLNALSGGATHLITVNDYLVKRDCDWIGAIFRFLGLTVGALVNAVPPHARKEIYENDIVYGTASEFGFDYLRDNSMVQSKEQQVQRGHYFAMIDEVDSILIDEARTPLIISGPSASSNQMYHILKDDVSLIVRLQRDYCNKLATKARKTLEEHNYLNEEELPKLSKEAEAEVKEALRTFWLVGKGTPRNKILKRMKENPLLRTKIDEWETYYYAEPNKEERQEALSELYMTVDERSSDYELTDKGIKAWIEMGREKTAESDFLMLDLGHEYALIDHNAALSEKEKLEKKVEIREEDAKRKERSHNLRQLLRAHLLMEKDVEYIVQEGKIVIIDENTGRPQPGRRFSDGLHQAIEAKEGVEIQGETQTYATITLQNYFRLYDKLSGMTGTAMTEALEFKEIYKLDVLAIPTHRKCVRKDCDDEVYMTEREKFGALLKDITDKNQKGRPILIGTDSVETSEKLARVLKAHRLKHTVLNAKNHEKEAEIIANAGKMGAITVATNMAGRGTDIKLEEGVATLGGLYVVGTTRHQSRRIDRQLRGRCARQGDPGSSKFYVSFEDALMRLFSSPRVTAMLQRFRPPEGEAITAKMLNKSIETAQKRVEQRNYTMRKHTLEYDDVMNKQRTEIYSFRNETLHADNLLTIAQDLIKRLIENKAIEFFQSKESNASWNTEGFLAWLTNNFPITFEKGEFDDEYASTKDLANKATDKVLHGLHQKIDTTKKNIDAMQEEARKAGHQANVEPERVINEVLRSILIRSVDSLWQEHLLKIDHLRTEVSLRAVGQRDPLQEFKHEAFALFASLSEKIQTDVAHALFKFQMVISDDEPERRQRKVDLSNLIT